MMRAAGHSALLAALVSIAGCASKPPATADAEGADGLRGSFATADSGDMLRKLTSTENGLELRKWQPRVPRCVR